MAIYLELCYIHTSIYMFCYTHHCQLCLCLGDKELLANGAYDLFAAKVRWNYRVIRNIERISI